MHRLQSKVPDMKVYYRFSEMNLNCKRGEYVRLVGSIANEFYNEDYDPSQAYRVEFRQVKKLYADYQDVTHFTLLLFPSVDSYKA